MKKKNYLFGIVVLITIICFSLASCAKNQFEGTWAGSDPDGNRIRVVVEDNSFSISWPDNPRRVSWTGSYAYDGNTATLVIQDQGINATAVVNKSTMVLTVPRIGAFSLTKYVPIKTEFAGTWISDEYSLDDGSFATLRIEVEENYWKIGFDYSDLGFSFDIITATYKGNTATLTWDDEALTATVSRNTLTLTYEDGSNEILTKK